MTPDPELMTKRELARLFHVSETTVGNWLTRGCPYRKSPGEEVGDGYGFDLEEVKQWRREQHAAGRPQGGRPLERLPRGSEERPDHENGVRYLMESAVRSYLWHWMTTDDGAKMALGFLVEARGGDAIQAHRDLSVLVLSLFYGFTGWVVADSFAKSLEASGTSIDALWGSYSGRMVTTTPPVDPDHITLQFPSWLLADPEQFGTGPRPELAQAEEPDCSPGRENPGSPGRESPAARARPGGTRGARVGGRGAAKS